MKTLFRPSLLLTQYVDHQASYEPLAVIAKRAADLGFDAIEIPCSCNPEIFDVAKASESQAYCDEVQAILSSRHIELAGLSTRLEGQFIAVDPSCKYLCAAYAPSIIRADASALRSWAIAQLHRAAQASRNLHLRTATTVACTLRDDAYERLHRRSETAKETIFQLANQWLSILEAFDQAGVDLCFALEAGRDLHDATSFDRFREAAKGHSRIKIAFNPSEFVLRQLDYLKFIDDHAGLIGAFEVQDADFHDYGPDPYDASENFFWRPGQYRTLGEGDVEFGTLFAKLAESGYSGWSTIKWNDMLIDPEETARRGAEFVRSQTLALV